MRRLAATATAVLLVLGAAPAAEAGRDYPQRKTVKDERGEVAASIDLVSGTFTSRAKTVTWDVRVAELTDTTFVAFEQVWEYDSWDRIAVFRENGATVARFYDIDDSEAVTTPTLLPCKGIKTTWDTAKDRVTVTAPTSCGIGRTAARRAEVPTWLEAYTRTGGDPASARDHLTSGRLGDIYQRLKPARPVPAT